jgi:hypothetical protein
VSINDDTWEITPEVPGNGRDGGKPPTLSPWSSAAVALEKGEHQELTDNGSPRAQARPPRWIASVAIAWTVALVAVLGAHLLNGAPVRHNRQDAAQMTKPRTAKRKDSRGRRSRVGQRRASLKSHRRSNSALRLTRHATSPTFASALPPAPAPEPFTPTPPRPPAPAPSPPTRPPPASGATVAKEFGFEH